MVYTEFTWVSARPRAGRRPHAFAPPPAAAGLPLPRAQPPAAARPAASRVHALKSAPHPPQVFVCSIFLGLFVAYGIGANDVANAFGSSVGEPRFRDR